MKLLAALSFLFAAVSWAQQPTRPLGQAFEIESAWKAHLGDDSRWAQPDFDDSSWGPSKSLPRTDGFAWHRMTVRIPEVTGPYALWIPRVLKAAEFFVNGQKIGAHGSVDQWYLERRDLVDPLPLPDGLKAGDILQLAVRVKQTTSGPGIPLNAVIGSRTAVFAQHRLALFEIYRGGLVSILMSVLVLGTALIAFLYWRGKADRVEALWVAAILLSYFFGDFEAYRGLGALQGWTVVAAIGVTISFWGAWRLFNGAPSLAWRAQAPYLAIFALLLGVSFLGRMEFFAWSYAITAIGAVQALLLVRNGIDTWRRVRQGEAWVGWFFVGYMMATVGSLVYYVDIIIRLVTGTQIGMANTWNLMLDPVKIDARNAGELISGGVMVGILVWRLNQLMDAKRSLLAELEAAKQVQDLLLPSAGTGTPGFVVDSAYRPATQVGGDFYYVDSLPGGRLLVVVGDVSGKGLRAAMLVSVAVGILRTAIPSSSSAVLAALNAGLAGRTGGGFVTACSVLFEADGAATIANAGHCPVYRNGEEVPMEPNLPLGVLADATFDEVHAEAGNFVLISDGVVEAENAQRELFGFDRTLELSGKSAQEIAEAAKAWGQTDDITVVTVRRIA